MTLVSVVFQIAAPAADWSRALAVALEGLALTVVVGTSRESMTVRRERALAVGALGVILVVLIATGAIGRDVSAVAGGVLAVGVPAALVGGLARLIRDRGVTLQAVLGALTIYLYVGLIFAWVIAFVEAVSSTPYFAQGVPGHGDRVYFSFSTLTTTGYGDYTPATSVGHALAVVEMLTGQLYLVTVIGVLIGDLISRRTRP